MQETTTEKKDFLIRNLESVRKNYDLQQLSSIQRGEFKEFSQKLGISRSTLYRAVVEARLLPKYPNLEKSKVQIIKYFKNEKELNLFMSKYNIYQLKFRELKKCIKRFHNDLSINPLLLLTREQHDILIGTGLGDGNFRDRNNKNVSFRVAHSKKQENYLTWKFSKLKEFTLKGMGFSIRKINGKEITMFEFRTITHPVFNYYHHLFYTDKQKRITKELLNQLNERSLAIWICDDGSYCKSLKYILLCTNSFSLEEHYLIKEFFNKKWGITPTIGFRDKKYYYLRFSVEDTKKIVKMIEPFIPVKEMLYKVNK